MEIEVWKFRGAAALVLAQKCLFEIYAILTRVFYNIIPGSRIMSFYDLQAQLASSYLTWMVADPIVKAERI